MKWFVVFFVGVFLLCATGQKFSSLNVGSSKEEVVAVLGSPDGQKMCDDTVTYFYTNRLISGWSWDRSDYYTKFLNGKLIEYGAGNVRQGMKIIWMAVP